MMQNAMTYLEQVYGYLNNVLTLLWVSLCVLGVVLKQAQFVENRIIPIILLIVGMIIGPFLVSPIIFGILKGAFCAGIAIGAYEVGYKAFPFILDFILSKIKEKLGKNS